MEEKTISFEKSKQFIRFSEIVYLISVFIWLFEFYYSKDAVTYIPYFFDSGVVWIISAFLLFLEYILLKQSSEEINPVYQAAIRGCLIAVMLFHGDTIGLLLMFIFLSVLSAGITKYEWKLYRSDVSILSCLASLELLGLLVLLNDRGSWWLQDSVVSSWIIDVLFIVSFLLIGKEKLWTQISEAAVLRPVCYVLSIISAIILSIITILSFQADAAGGIFLNEIVSSIRDDCVTVFSRYTLLPEFAVVRGSTQHDTVFFCLYTFLFGLWCYVYTFREAKLKVVYTTLAMIIASFGGLWIHPVFFLVGVTLITLVAEKTTDINLLVDGVIKLPLVILGIALVVILAVSYGISEGVVTARENEDERLAEIAEKNEYQKIKPLVVEVDRKLIKNRWEAGLICSVDDCFYHEDVIDINGWAFVEGEAAKKEEIVLCLMNKETGIIYQIYTVKHSRMDIAELYKKRIYEYCGYSAKLPTGELESGEYEVLFYVRTGGKNGRLIDSGETIDMMNYSEYQVAYNATKPKKIELEDEIPTAEEANIVYNIEDVEKHNEFLRIRGWVFATGYTMPNEGFKIALVDDKSSDAYEINVKYIERHDVTEAYIADGANYDQSGFYAVVNTKKIPKGWYYVYFNTESDAGYTWTSTDYIIIVK